MPVLHSNTTFDPEERAIAIVAELEKEVLDDDMLCYALTLMAQAFEDRMKASHEKTNDEHRQRVMERRRDRLAAKIKGIPAMQPKGNIIQGAGLLPSRH